MGRSDKRKVHGTHEEQKVVDYCESNNSILRSELNKEAGFFIGPGTTNVGPKSQSP